MARHKLRRIHPKDLLVIKLGGSAITNKERRFQARARVIDGMAKAISKIKARIVLIHGGGSFAHPVVREYGIHLGYQKKSQLLGFTETKCKLIELNRLILSSLRRHGLPAVPFMPSSFIVANNGRLVDADTRPLEMLMKLGLVPLIHGDVVADERKGFSVISGDQIAIFLAKRLGARMVIFGTDVDGIFTSDPKRNPEAKIITTIRSSSIEDMLGAVGETTAPDVTLGMLGKLTESKELVKNGTEVVIINATRPESLGRLLEGKSVICTRIVPS